MKTFFLLCILFFPTQLWAEYEECSGSGSCGLNKACFENNCLNTGTVKVTLSWTSQTDLDLYVKAPSGKTLSLDNPFLEGGRLQAECEKKECRDDQVAERDASYPHVEHVAYSYDTKVQTGRYRVWVKNFDGFQSARFKLIFEDPSGKKTVKNATISQTKGAKSTTYSFTVKAPRDCRGDADTDGDGLCDKWETEGIDVNGDGVIDLDLPGLGADPKHKDIFVEVDWMKNHKPYNLSNVVAAFDNANVSNPDGSDGIRLHIFRSEEITAIRGRAVSATQAIGLGDVKGIKFGSRSYACGEKAWFGSLEERQSKNCKNISNASKKVYHYAVFGYDRKKGGGSSGVAELGGNDLLVTVRNSSQDSEQSTFMHELGHNLGLRHGGGDGVHHKPNYLSVMSYSYQFRGNYYPGRPLDYSREKLPSLNERSLDEEVGISGPASWTTVAFGSGSGAVQLGGPADGPQNWNTNMRDDERRISVDISNIKGRSRGLTTLVSHDDWGNIKYNFRTSSKYASGDENQEEFDEEPEDAYLEEEALTLDEVSEQASQVDSDNDGINNRDDLCPAISNPDQKDSDGDGVGDSCDSCPEDAAPGLIDGCPESDDVDVDIDNPPGRNGAYTPHKRPMNDDELRDFLGLGKENPGEPEPSPELIDTKSGCSNTQSTPLPFLFLFGFFFLGRRRRRKL